MLLIIVLVCVSTIAVLSACTIQYMATDRSREMCWIWRVAILSGPLVVLTLGAVLIIQPTRSLPTGSPGDIVIVQISEAGKIPRDWAGSQTLGWIAIGVWMIWICMAGGSRLRRNRRSRRWLSARQECASEIAHQSLVHLASQMDTPKSVRLSERSSLRTPIALPGEICLPLGSAETLPFGELESVLAHELAHICRGDWAWKQICDWIALILPMQPTLRWAARQQEAASEFACDELAISWGTCPIQMARCLTRFAEAPPHANAPGWIGGRSSQLVERVSALLTTSESREKCSRIVCACILGLSVTATAVVAGAGVVFKSRPHQSVDNPAGLLVHSSCGLASFVSDGSTPSPTGVGTIRLGRVDNKLVVLEGDKERVKQESGKTIVLDSLGSPLAEILTRPGDMLVRSARLWPGVNLGALIERLPNGWLVCQIEPKSYAEDLGFIDGDIILSANDDGLQTWLALRSVFFQPFGRYNQVQIQRDGKLIDIRLPPFKMTDYVGRYSSHHAAFTESNAPVSEMDELAELKRLLWATSQPHKSGTLKDHQAWCALALDTIFNRAHNMLLSIKQFDRPSNLELMPSSEYSSKNTEQLLDELQRLLDLRTLSASL